MKFAKLLRKTVILLLILALAFTVIWLNKPSESSERIFPKIFEASYDEVQADMLQQISEYKTTLEFDNVPEETMAAAFEELYLSHPEFFWLRGGYSYTITTYKFGNTHISMKLMLNIASESIPAMDKELRQTVRKIVSKADNSWSDFDKALYAHDYITQTCSYDKEFIDSLAEKDDEDAAFSSTLGSTAYGCLVDRLAICSGYTNAFQLLMNELGVECGKTRGWAGFDGDTQSHIWNYVTLDGEKYFIDVTWDDAIGTENGAEYPDHSYFCVTGEELYKSHELRPEETDPGCTGKQYNYHVHNGYYLDAYDYSEVGRIIKLQIENDLIEIKFGSETELQRACTELFDNKGIFGIPCISDYGYCTVWHSMCEDSCVLVMWIEER